MSKYYDHKYFVYEKPHRSQLEVKLVIQDILNTYIGSNKSNTQLKKMKLFRLNCYDPSGRKADWQSNDLSYELVEEYILKNNQFDYKFFNAYEIKCDWLDGNIHISLPQHFVDQNGDTVKSALTMNFGNSFPIKPTIDREGVLYNSFQNTIADKIIKLHHKLIIDSDRSLETDWLFDLISLITYSISIIDITLNKLLNFRS